MGQALKVIKFDPDENLDGKEISKPDSDIINSSLLVPLKIAAIVTAILGVVSLVLEVKIYFQFRYEIYLARLFPTIFSLITLILLQTKIGKKKYILLTHVFLFTILSSLSFVAFKVPKIFPYNVTAAALFLLTLSLFLLWGSKNQIIAGIYFVLLFGISSVLSNFINIENGNQYLLFSSSFLIIIISIFASRIRKTNNQSSTRSSYQRKNSNGEGKNDEFDSGFLQNSIIPFFQIKLNGDFEFANQSLCEILKLSNEDEFNGLNFFQDILKNEKVKAHLLKKIENKGRVENYRFTYSGKDGAEEILIMDCNSKNNNDEIYLEGSIKNITTQYRNEKKIRNELATLQQNSRQKSKIIPNISNNTGNRSTVISKMGHELRTPMNSVLGFLTLIENGLFENNEELKEFSHSAKLSAESLLGLINDVVEIAKIQEGSVEIEQSEFNIRDEIGRITADLTPHLKLSELTLSTNIKEDVPDLLLADNAKYSQIVQNLLSNAIKISEGGNLKLSVSVSNQQSNTNGIKLLTTVEDCSNGIPEDELQNLVGPDDGKVRGSKITSSVLHIMICKELIALLDGSISASSNIGEGNKFSFSIDVDTVDMKSKRENSDEPNLKPSNQGRPKLLLVEDNPISRKVEKKLLEEAGYNVDCVEKGAEAIEKIELGNYNLVLMDIELKDMDGLEATKQIRQLPNALCNIPIIAVTAHSSMKDREKCLIAGMNDYISKPINITFLKMTIDQWLNQVKIK